jgi:3-phenylpropionate/trans-cinnamate dioxygenase ferredoxin reductase subunit
LYQSRIRIESVDSGSEQAKVAAASILQREKPSAWVPWFWSDQFAKLLIGGINLDYDRALLRGDPSCGTFTCCYLRDGQLLAVDCVNNTKDFTTAKKLIAQKARLEHAPQCRNRAGRHHFVIHSRAS